MNQATDTRATPRVPLWHWGALSVVALLFAAVVLYGYGLLRSTEPAGVATTPAVVDPDLSSGPSAEHATLPRPFPPGVSAAASALTVLDGSRVVGSASNDGMLRVSVDGKQLISAMAHNGMPVTAMAFSSDGRTVLSGGGDSELRAWDLESGAERLSLRGHEQPITAVAVSTNGATFCERFSRDARHVVGCIDRQAAGRAVRPFRLRQRRRIRG